MAIPFTKLKSAGLPQVGIKLAKMAKERKASRLSTIAPKTVKGKSQTPFNFSKFLKAPKLPKAPKVAILKKAIKKVKNAGF